MKAERIVRQQRRGKHRQSRQRRGFTAQAPRREIGIDIRRQALAILRLLLSSWLKCWC